MSAAQPRPAQPRLAFVAPRFAEGATVGGAETLLKALAQRAAAAGCAVDFLTTCARDHFTWANAVPAGWRDADGLRVGFFPVDGERDLETFIRIQDLIGKRIPLSADEERAWLDNNVNSRPLIEHLRREGHTYDRIVMGPYLFGLIYHAAQAHPERTLLVPCLHDEPFAYLASFRELFRQVRGCLFNTEPERTLAQRLYGDLPRAAVVGMGLDPFSVTPGACRRAHPGLADYIIYCGRREGGKGTPLLLDYLNTFRLRTGRDVKLVLTGAGAIQPPPELAPHILDLGFVSEVDKQAALADAVAFCHPSINESLSIVLLEAWLAGTPALVHGRGAVLRHQCQRAGGGLWFTTYPEFEAELALLLDDASLRARMGAAGRDFVRREYDWATVTERLMRALTD